MAEVRPVVLWGQHVLVAEDGRIWCDGCWRLLPLDALTAVDNRHRVGLPGVRGVLLPLGPDTDAAGTVTPAW